MQSCNVHLLIFNLFLRRNEAIYRVFVAYFSIYFLHLEEGGDRGHQCCKVGGQDQTFCSIRLFPKAVIPLSIWGEMGCWFGAARLLPTICWPSLRIGSWPSNTAFCCTTTGFDWASEGTYDTMGKTCGSTPDFYWITSGLIGAGTGTRVST